MKLQAAPRVLLATACLLVLAVLAAGCGGGGSKGTKSASEWADGVCSALNTWTDSLRSAGQSLSGGNLSKSTLESATSDVKDATARLKDDLSGLGTPDTKSGDKAKQSIDDLSSKLQQDVGKIEEAVKGASSTSSLMGVLPSMSATLTDMSKQVKDTFTELQQLDPKGELAKAFKDTSSCSTLTS
jgi:hypothetical protein